jgi:hypothetical protein
LPLDLGTHNLFSNTKARRKKKYKKKFRKKKALKKINSLNPIIGTQFVYKNLDLIMILI